MPAAGVDDWGLMSKPVLPVLATASGMLLLALPGAAQADGCGGVGVTSKATAGVTVGSGQNLAVCGGQVNGSIVVKPGGSLTVENTHVTGGITSHGATSVQLCNDTIVGNVGIDHSTGQVFVGDPDDDCAANTLGGTLRIEYNADGVDVSDNTIHGMLSFDNNVGSNDSMFCPDCTFEPELGDNFVFGSIVCEDNGGTPPGVFTDGGPDRALGAIVGDCASEGTMK
jgi:hypothetical protein